MPVIKFFFLKIVTSRLKHSVTRQMREWIGLLTRGEAIGDAAGPALAPAQFPLVPGRQAHPHVCPRASLARNSRSPQAGGLPSTSEGWESVDKCPASLALRWDASEACSPRRGPQTPLGSPLPEHRAWSVFPFLHPLPSPLLMLPFFFF